MDTFIQSPVTTNTPRNIANVPNERRITSEILAEMIKVFKELTLQPKINDSAYYNSDKNYTESDPKIDPLVATHTSDRKKINVTDTGNTNENSPQILLINRTLLIIILSIDARIPDGVAVCRGTLHA